MNITYIPASEGRFFSESALNKIRQSGTIPIVANDIYLKNRFRPERIQIEYGGSGSGKSDWKATELLLKCLKNEYCRVLFTRKHSTQIRDSQFLLFKDLIKRYALGEYFHVKETEMDVICKINGNMMLSAGLDDVDKLKSVSDITDIWIEEPMDKRGSVSSADFTELNRRLRCNKASNHLHMTFNPISIQSWIHEYFFKSNAYGAFTLKTTYKDNHFSPESEHRQFEILKEKKPDEYEVYALGNWGSLKQGLVFPEYSIVTTFPTDCKKSGIGLDWGFFPDPTAVVRCGIKEGVLYLDELIYDYYLTSGTRAAMMKDRGVLSTDKIIADRNPEAIAELKKLGFWSIEAADKGPGSIKAGIDMMKGYKLAITDRSKNIKTELDNYEWATDRHSELPTGTPIDTYNHAIDSARYWLQSQAHVKRGARFANG